MGRGGGRAGRVVFVFVVGAGGRGGEGGILAFTCRLVCICFLGCISSFPFLRLLCVVTLLCHCSGNCEQAYCVRICAYHTEK